MDFPNPKMSTGCDRINQAPRPTRVQGEVGLISNTCHHTEAVLRKLARAEPV
jgi:hypothetical protein